jgi:death-on-curing protein
MSIARLCGPISTLGTRTRYVTLDDEPFWLTFEDVCDIHDEQLRIHGGLPGFKEQGLVESAVFAPQNLYRYTEQDNLLALAISLCFSISKNHGFLDGNKRTAAFSMIEFLALNGYDLFVPDDDPVTPLLGTWVEKLTIGAYSADYLYDILEHFVQEAPER